MKRHGTVFAVTIFAIVVFAFGNVAYAECNIAPSVGVSVSPQPTGVPVITVTYSFPDTTSPTQRGLALRIRRSNGGLGNVASFQPPDASGTWVVNHEMFCEPSATYTYEATATSCGREHLRHTGTAAYTHNVKPTVSVSYDGPDEQGHGNVVVEYDFPNTSHSSQRSIIDRVWDAGGSGIAASLSPTDQSGTWTFPYPMTCRTGTFRHEVTARSCGGETDVAETTVSVDTKPTVSLAVGPVQEDGEYDYTITYNFPNTDSNTQRSISVLHVDPNGGFGTHLTVSPTQQSGELNLTHSVMCDTRDRTIRVIATSCTQQQDVDEQPMPKATPPKVSVALTKSIDEPGKIDALITYDMGQASTNWRISLALKSWLDADGTVHTGHTLFGPAGTDGQRIGTIKYTFSPPSGAQQVFVTAKAESCVGADEKEAFIECDDCLAASDDPVFFSTGNVQVTDADPLPPIGTHRLVRTYNSDEQVVAPFGRGWTTLFDRRAILNTVGTEQVVALVTATNQVVAFRGSGGVYRQVWPRGRRSSDVLTYDSVNNTYLHRSAGSNEVAVFRVSDGHLIALRDVPTGRETQITYTAQGLPQTIADSWTGTQWMFTNDTVNRRVSSISVDGHSELVWSYGYDGAGNLTTVTAPGNATWRTYEYVANRMTASYDGLGNLIESHTYDANGYGISSTGPSDEIANIEYNFPGSVANERLTRVTYKTGATAEYRMRPIAGAYRPVEVTGGCSSCGAGDVTYVHDDEGRIIRRQGSDGYVSQSTFSATHLVSKERFLRPAGCDPEADAQRCRLGTDALATVSLEATSATFETTFEHSDSHWPDKVTRTTTPSVIAANGVRREDVTYHSTRGVPLSSAVSGWTREPAINVQRRTRTTLYGDCDPEDGCNPTRDDGLHPAFSPGGNFNSAWLTLPQPAGLPKVIDGPRTEVKDAATFVYYPINASVPALLRGKLAATKNAAGHLTRYENYDVFGNATRVVDANGVALEIAFDALGRLSTTTTKGIPGCNTTLDPLCATDLVTARSYFGTGPLESETAPMGALIAYTYDARGRVHTISRGPLLTDLREQIEYSYDPLTGKKSRERALSFENNAWIEKRREDFAYDSQGRLQAVTHADDTSVQYTYDPADRLVGVRDENHSSPNMRHMYDPAGRLATVTQALSTAASGEITTSYTYDLHGNLNTVTDANGNVTSYVYDDFGQKLRQTSHVTGVTTYSYDGGGNRVSNTDANGTTTARVYDVLGRLTSSVSTTSSGGMEEVQWTYDTGAFSVGRVVTMTDPTGATAYAYERRGILASEVKTIAGTAYNTGFGYDANGNRARITYPSGRVVTYGFDYANRPVTANNGATPLVTSTLYLPFGPAREMTFGNGLTRQMEFDTRYRMKTNVLGGGGGDTIASYSYDYDAVGNVTAIDDDLDPSFDRAFGYDDLNRLTSANTGEALWGAGSYSYDEMGNMRMATMGTRDDRVFSYSGSTPKLSSVAENGVERSVIYDAVGNEIAVGASSYAYTPRNHLRNQNGITYTYDGRGIRTVTLRPTSILLFNVPSTLSGGTTGQAEIVLSSPAPSGGAVVTLTSTSAIASVPDSVAIAAGQTTGAFTIATQTVSGEQSVELTASFNGFTQSATVRVVGSRFDEVFIEPEMIIGGETARGLVSLSSPAPEGGLAVTLESSNAATRVPEAVVIPGGEREVEFPIVTAPVVETTVVRIAVSVGGDGREMTLHIQPPSLASLSFEPSVLHGGFATTGTVTLNGRAPEGGRTVTIDGDSQALTLPQTVFIAGGEQSATFAATVTPVEVASSTRVIASMEEERVAANLTIEPPQLTNLTVTPAAVVGGEPITADVTLNAPAAPEGARVQLGTSNSEIVPVPTNIVVSSAQATESTSVTTAPVTAPTPVVISATRAGVTRSTAVTIQPPSVTLASLSTAPTSLVGSNQVVGTITLTGLAPEGGIEVELLSSDPTVAAPPSAATVPAGHASATFVIQTAVVTAPIEIVVSAGYATTQKSATLTVQPPVGNHVATVSVTPAFIVGGTTATVTVTLAAPSSDNGGSKVTIASDSPILSVPSSVKIHQNATSATFTVAAATVTEANAVVVTASYGGVVRRTRAVVAPENAVTIAALTLSPDRVTGGTATSGVVTLTGPAPFGGAAVSLQARRRNIVTMPATVTVPEGATSVTFPIATEIVHGNKSRSLEIEASYNGVTSTATLTVTPSSIAQSITPVALCASTALEPCLTRSAANIAATSAVLYDRQYYLYTPELNLLAESAATAAVAPSIAYEYVWFAGEPLMQVAVATNELHYYFNDHLGTPILQTDESARVAWRIEANPYGDIYASRRGEGKHQPLAFPGQERGSGEETYNVYRWYRSAWGRYTQNDPIDAEPFRYAASNPIGYSDPFGLYEFTDHETIKNVPQLHILDEYCRAETGGACTGNRLVWATCPCKCTDSGYKMEITVNVRYTIFVFSGPWPRLTARRRVHPSVTNRASAIQHEHDFHLSPAKRMIGELLAGFEEPLYESQAACDFACETLRGMIHAEFENLLSDTQRVEEEGGDPRTLGW